MHMGENTCHGTEPKKKTPINEEKYNKLSVGVQFFDINGFCIFSNILADNFVGEISANHRGIDEILYPVLKWNQTKELVDNGLLVYYGLEISEEAKRFEEESLSNISDIHCYLLKYPEDDNNSGYYLHLMIPELSEEKEILDTWCDAVSVLSSVPGYAAFLHEEFRILSTSKSLAIMTDKKKENLIGSNALDLFERKDRQRIREYVDKETTYPFVLSLIRKNGSSISVLATGAPCPIGQYNTRLVVLKDISKLMDAEKQFLASEKRFERFFNGLPVYCFLISRNGYILDFNDTARDKLGYQKSDLIGKSFIQLFHNEHFAVLKEKNKTWRKSGHIYANTLKIKTKKGSYREVILQGEANSRSDSPFLNGIFVLTDITENVRAEKERRDAEVKAKMYFDVADVIFLILDRNGNITSGNPKLSEILQLDMDSIIGKNWFDEFLRESDKNEIMAIHENIVEGNIEPYRFVENDIVLDDGSVRTIAWRNTVISSEDGNIIGTLSSGMDITQRKEYEVRLIKTQKALSRCNQTIIRLDSEKNLYDAIVKIIVEDAGYVAAVIGRLENGEPDIMTFAGSVDNITKTLLKEMDENKETNPIVEAILTHSPVTSSISTKEKKPVSWIEFLKENGCIGSIVLPLILDTNVYGFMLILTSNPDSFSKQEGLLLEEIANNLAFGISSIHIRQHLDDALTTLTKSEERYRTLADSSLQGIQIMQATPLRFLYVNDAFGKFLGYDTSELLQMESKEIERLIHPDDRSIMLEFIKRRVRDLDAPNEYTVRSIRKDGSVVWLRNSAVLIEFDGKPVSLISSIDMTKEVFAKKGLERTVENYRILVSNIPGAVYRCRMYTKWTMLFLSDAIEEIVGFPPSDFIKNKRRSYHSIIHPEDARYVWNTIHEAVVERKQFQLKYRVIHSDTRVRWVREIGSGSFGDDGEVKYLEGVILDITNEIETQMDLEENEKRYRMLYETMTQGVIYQDNQGVILFANPAAEKILGQTFEEMKGRMSDSHIWQAKTENGEVFPGDQHPSMAALRTGKQIKDVVMGVYNPRMKEYRWIRIDAVPLFGEDTKQPTSVYTIFSDMTESKRRAEILRREQAIFKNTIASINEGILVQDSDGRIIHANSRFSAIWNIDHIENNETSIDSVLYGLASKLNEPSEFIEFTRSIDENLETRVESLYLVNGTILDVYTTPIQLEKDVLFRVWVFRDITQLKKAEESTILLMDLMGHDIRNYLQGLLIGLDIIESTSEISGKGFDEMRNIVNRCSALITQVKKTEGIYDSSIVTISLTDEVRKALDNTSDILNDVVVNTSGMSQEAAILGNEYVHLILTNIIENSIVHNTSEQKEVWLSIDELDDKYEVRISDNGIGIDDLRKEFLFDKSRRYGGIGLHQALQIADTIKAEIEVQDRIPNNSTLGTTFQIRFLKSNGG